ncbi:MAG: hypothetical protein CES88_10735 [Halobacteriovorax sp. JY17]|nr:MAG: hypothetical protein CES88_10735 [Halobacteriovorax sp. JY17]
MTLFLVILFSKRVMRNRVWTATMTPLASIIGSGFLIAAPLLNELSGDNAPYLMLILCIASFCVGEVIRWNIMSVESIVEKGAGSKKILLSEKVGEWALAFAYILSITYYLYLFSSFFLRMTHIYNPVIEKGVVTLLFVGISFFGHQHGLNSLEKIESISVNVKLSIILTILVALGVYHFSPEASIEVMKETKDFNFDTLFISLGLLIMVQGFETSRYLSEKYSGALRVKSMRNSQIISSMIYMLLIILFIPVFDHHPLGEKISETSVIDIGKFVFVLAPTFLFAAAMSSQLSAAIADMGGGGGLFSELSNKRINSKNAYLLIAASGIFLVWTFDIFKIISFASKAFALYYSFQCLSSTLYQFRKNHVKFVFSILVGTLCLGIFILGRPFE